jgi:hypothetical protein
MINLLKQFILMWVFLCLGFGIFYTSMRFNVPWYGNNDFEEYSKMVEKPFDNDAISPFAYRVLTPTLAHLIHKSGLYFQSKSPTPFQDKFSVNNGTVYQASVLQSMIFTNFIFIMLACMVLAAMVRKSLLGFNNDVVMLLQVFIPMLLMLSLSTIRDGLAGINEGGGLFFITLMLYSIRSRNLVLFVLVAFLSIFQREIASIIFLVYIISMGSVKQNKYYALACLGAFATYLIIKLFIYPIAGWDQQTNIFAMIQNFLKLDRDFIKHLIFGNNILYALFFLAIFMGKRISNLKLFTPYLLTIIFVILLSAAQGIGNSIDRTINLILPIFLMALIDLFKAGFLDIRESS